MRRSALTLAGLALLALALGAAAVAGAVAGAVPPFLMAFGSKGTAPGTFHGPDNVAVDARGQVYVADRENDRVQKFDRTGRVLAVLGGSGKGPGQFHAPRGVTVDALGDIYVADSANNRIQEFDSAGRLLSRRGRNGGDGAAGTGPGEFNDPRGITTDLRGDLFVADHGNNRIQKLDPSGRVLAVWGRNGGDGSAGTGPGEFHNPRGVALDTAGDVFVADKANNRIQRLDPAGHFALKWGRNGGDGSAGVGSGELRSPYSVAVGPDGEVYVADTGNNRLQTFTPTGAFLSRLGHNGGDGSPGSGPGEFRGDYGLAFDCRGDLFVSDEDNERIQVFGTAGPPAACPPTLSVGRLPARASRGALAASASCDRPCALDFRLSARIHGRRRFIERHRQLGFGVFGARVRLRLPGLARALARSGRHGRLRVRLTASATGFGGTRTVVRERRVAR